MPADDPECQWLGPSFVNHRVHLIGNHSPGSLCDYDYLQELFCYPKSSLLVLRNIVISTGLWLRNILVSTGLGKWERPYSDSLM